MPSSVTPTLVWLLPCEAAGGSEGLNAAQESVLEEAKIMIPDTKQRLEGALQDLTNYVVRLANSNVPLLQ